MLQVVPIDGLGEIAPGTNLGSLLTERLTGGVPALLPGDVLVVAQKIISKAEGRHVRLSDVAPSPEAVTLAAEVGKDPALVELILRESHSVVRKAPNVLITRHRNGHVMANAGIDASNIGPGRGDSVLLLPQDPNASAAAIRDEIARGTGICPAVVVSDSFGRPWRLGTVNVALGLAGMPAVIDQRGGQDRDGRVLQVTQTAVADAVAAAAGLVMGEAAEGRPAAVVRGWVFSAAEQRASDRLLRPLEEDLFR
jgi:coenzyme F420-0:L-glutamate ligase/coenzyme F420-1:gamma-L-glutamate ligase